LIDFSLHFAGLCVCIVDWLLPRLVRHRTHHGSHTPLRLAQGAAASMAGFMEGEGAGYDDLIDDDLDFM